MFGDVAQVLEATKLGGRTPQSGAEFEVPRVPRQGCWRQVCEELPGGPDREAAAAPGDGTGEPAVFYASDGVEGPVPGQQPPGEWEVVLLVFALQKVGVWPVDAACVGPGLLCLVHDDEEEEQHM